jgi:hypothetical protein
MECVFCKKILSTQYSLKTHQKTTKSCLKIQGIENKNFECFVCKKTFEKKFTYQKHIRLHEKEIELSETNEELKIENQDDKDIIKNLREENKKFIEENKNLREENIVLKEKIKGIEKENKKLDKVVEKIAIKAIEKPTKVVNIQNINCVTEQGFKDAVQYFDRRIALKDNPGFHHANFAMEHTPIKYAICSDKNRKNFKFYDEHKNLVFDKGGKKLTQKYCEVMKDPFNDVYNEEIEKVHEDIENNQGIFEENIEKGQSLRDLNLDINRASSGQDTKTFHEFTRVLSGKLSEGFEKHSHQLYTEQ